jgi:2-octaprenyl-3-methyl-6-methoxy-1,4-benzoquinol hydroxylase
MTLQHTEVAVVGGGMVGGALALGLAQQGFEVTVIEQAAPPAFDPASKPDVRISAISAASVDLLRGLGVWEAVQAMRAHPYSRLEIIEKCGHVCNVEQPDHFNRQSLAFLSRQAASSAL